MIKYVKSKKLGGITLKLKQIVLFLMVLVLTFSLCGCAKTTPEGTVKSLFSALKEYDIEKMTEVLVKFPDAEGCNVTYNPFSDVAYVNLYKKAYPDLAYEIISITESGENSATAVLKVTHPDLKSAYSTALYTSMAMIFSNEELFNNIIENEDMEISNYVPTQMQNLVVQGKVETIESEFTLTLTKGEDGWRIVTDDQLKNLVSSNLYLIASGTENIFANEEE